jgi:hypothetical protein
MAGKGRRDNSDGINIGNEKRYETTGTDQWRRNFKLYESDFEFDGYSDECKWIDLVI